jgi:glycosyltransferase involved in cell wall biosynthesis
MKILIVVDGKLPSPGGAEAQAVLLASSFKARGHVVHILAPRFDRSEALEETIQGVPLTRIAYPRVRLFGALILVARFAWLVGVKYRSWDAIHIHMAKNLAAVAGLMRGISRWTLTVKISGAWEFEHGILDPSYAGSPIVRIFNALIQRADAIQSISAFTRKMLLCAGYRDEQIKMIPNAVDLARFKEDSRGDSSASPTVMFVGRLVPVKALDVLLEAWARIDPAHDARLVFVGDGPVRASLESQAERLGVSSNVHFVGTVSDVRELLNAADIYVQCSYQEGLPNSVLEAMACGLPIVATRVSGNEDLVADEENGLLVPPGNAAELSAALERLLRDPALRRRMGVRSREKIVKQYELGQVLQQLEKVYAGAE